MQFESKWFTTIVVFVNCTKGLSKLREMKCVSFHKFFSEFFNLLALLNFCTGLFLSGQKSLKFAS